MRRRLPHHVALAVAAMVSLVACNAVLGIEERTLDPCAQYCETIAANCVDDHRQYQSDDVCLAACARLEAGDAEKTTGNTVSCRLAEAEAAKSDPVEHCATAGFAGRSPSGDQPCGPLCPNYCELIKSICPGTAPAKLPAEECESLCLAVPKNPNYTPEDLNIKDHDNSIECRVWHLGVATKDFADGLESSAHCAHAEGLVKCDGVIPGEGGAGGGASGGAGGQ